MLKNTIKKGLLNFKEKFWRNKAVIIFYVIVFSFIILSYMFPSEKNIPSQNGFCSPEQFLRFLTISGFILGIFIAFRHLITKKFGNFIVYFTCILIFGLLLFF